MSTTPMTKIREEFNQKFYITEGTIDEEFKVNFGDEIADWWLNRFQQELEKLELEIKKFLLPVREKASVGQKRRRQIHNSIINKMLIIIRQHKER